MTGGAANEDDLAAALSDLQADLESVLAQASRTKPDPDILCIGWLAVAFAAATAAARLIRHDFGTVTVIHVSGAAICIAFVLVYRLSPKLWRLDPRAAELARAEYESAFEGAIAAHEPQKQLGWRDTKRIGKR